MPTDRFQFQQDCVRRALELDGVIINVGCLDDQRFFPQNSIKALDNSRVINTDLYQFDPDPWRNGEYNAADLLFDAAKDRWPFEDGSAALVVLGEILEHMTPDEISATLTEARRVSKRLCITSPEDARQGVNGVWVSDEFADEFPRGIRHRTTVTEGLLRVRLEAAGWTVRSWELVEYDSGEHWGVRTMGHWVEAE